MLVGEVLSGAKRKLHTVPCAALRAHLALCAIQKKNTTWVLANTERFQKTFNYHRTSLDESSGAVVRPPSGVGRAELSERPVGRVRFFFSRFHSRILRF